MDSVFVIIILFLDKYNNMYGLGGKEYIYHHTEDESTFQLVDTSRLQRPLHLKARPKINHVRRVLE